MKDMKGVSLVQLPNFKHIYQNSRAYHRSKKKSALINYWENLIIHWKESEQSKALRNKLDLLQIQLGVAGGDAAQENVSIFTLFKIHKQS